MAKFKKLHAQQGSDEVNVQEGSFRVDHNGDVEVPETAVGPLLAVGGFTMDEERDATPTGHVQLIHLDGATSCSWGGVSYEARDDGSFAVPSGAVADLASHGFVGVEAIGEEAEPEPASAKTLKLKIPPT